jgi:hypothetical protein
VQIAVDNRVLVHARVFCAPGAGLSRNLPSARTMPAEVVGVGYAFPHGVVVMLGTS